MKLDKTTLMKVGIAVAVAMVVYLIYRSRSCKDAFAGFAPTPVDDEYAENMFQEGAADYAEEGDDYAEEGHQNHNLMESTMDDDQANAMFEPEL